MPKKPITWVGSLVILGAGVFCFTGLYQYRAGLPAFSSQIPWVTAGAFGAVIIALGAVSLWFYLNEKR